MEEAIPKGPEQRAGTTVRVGPHLTSLLEPQVTASLSWVPEFFMAKTPARTLFPTFTSLAPAFWLPCFADWEAEASGLKDLQSSREIK